MTDERRPGAPGGERAAAGGYEVPPQYRTPPDAGYPPRAWGPGSAGYGAARPAWGLPAPPLVPPEDAPVRAWSPGGAAPFEPGRWEPGRFGPVGGAAAVGEPTVIRGAAVPPPEAHGIPEWERSKALRNALVAAAVILLVGSLIATYLVFRSGKDAKAARPVPSPALQPDGQVFLEPPPPDPVGAGDPPVPSTLPVIAPVAPPPVPPPTTAATIAPAGVPATAPPTTPAAPPTTRAAQPATTTTTRRPAIPPMPTTGPASPTTTTTTTRSR